MLEAPGTLLGLSSGPLGLSSSVLARAVAALHYQPSAVTYFFSMARTVQFALYVTTAVSAADVPQLRGRQLQSQSGKHNSNHVAPSSELSYADVPQFSVVEDVATLSANLTSQYCSPQWAGNCNCDWMANNGDDGSSVDKCSCACREKNPECTDYGRSSHFVCYGCMFCKAVSAGNYDCSWMNNCGDDGVQSTPAATACRSKYASQCGYHYR